MRSVGKKLSQYGTCVLSWNLPEPRLVTPVICMCGGFGSGGWDIWYSEFGLWPNLFLIRSEILGRSDEFLLHNDSDTLLAAFDRFVQRASKVRSGGSLGQSTTQKNFLQNGGYRSMFTPDGKLIKKEQLKEVLERNGFDQSVFLSAMQLLAGQRGTKTTNKPICHPSICIPPLILVLCVYFLFVHTAKITRGQRRVDSNGGT